MFEQLSCTAAAGTFTLVLEGTPKEQKKNRKSPHVCWVNRPNSWRAAMQMAAGSREGDGRRGWKLQWHGGQVLCTSCSIGQRSGRGRKSERRVFHARSRSGWRAVPGVGKEIGGRAGGAGIGPGPGGAAPEVGLPRHHSLRSARPRMAAAAAQYPYARRRARARAWTCVFLSV